MNPLTSILQRLLCRAVASLSLAVTALLVVACGPSPHHTATSHAAQEKARQLMTNGRSLLQERSFYKAIAAYDSVVMLANDHPQELDSLVGPATAALVQIGNAYQVMGQADSAVVHLQTLYDEYPVLQDKLRRDYLSILGYFLSRTERMKEAEHTTELALTLPLYNATHDRLFRDYAYAAAVFFSDKDEVERVSLWGKHALEEARLSGNVSGAQYVRNLLGLLYKQTGRFAEAVDILNESIHESKALKDTLGHITALTSLVSLYTDWNMESYAMEISNESVRLLEAYQGEHSLTTDIQVYIQRGYACAPHHKDTTLRYYDQAERLAKDLPYNSGQVDVDLHKGALLATHPQMKRVEEGLTYLRRAKEKATGMNRAKAYYYLGYSLARAGYDEEGEAMLDTMYNIVANSNTHLYLGLYYKWFVDRYTAKGDDARLLRYLKMHFKEEYIDSTRNVNYYLAKNHVDQQLKQERLILDAEQQQLRTRRTWLVVGIALALLTIVASVVIVTLRQRWYHARQRLAESRMAELTAKIHQLELNQNLPAKERAKAGDGSQHGGQSDGKQDEQHATPLVSSDDVQQPTILSANRLIRQGDEETFVREFEKVYPTFLRHLRQRVSNIGKREELLCMFIILDLRTSEIAELMGISDSSVRMLRHRVRQKLKLPTSDSLDDEIKQLV